LIEVGLRSLLVSEFVIVIVNVKILQWTLVEANHLMHVSLLRAT